MGKNRNLSDAEKTTIKAHAQNGITHKAIDNIEGKKRRTITKILKKNITFKVTKKIGRPALLFKRDKRKIVFRATYDKQSNNKICNEFNLNLSTRKVQKVLKETPKIDFIK